jgi:hypothetical protein
MLSHRYRPLTATTDVTLVAKRNAGFEHGKVAVSDLVIRVARHATADCTLRTDDLLAFARNQHVSDPGCMRLPRTIKPSGPTVRCDGRPNYVWLTTRGAGMPERTL